MMPSNERQKLWREKNSFLRSLYECLVPILKGFLEDMLQNNLRQLHIRQASKLYSNSGAISIDIDKTSKVYRTDHSSSILYISKSSTRSQRMRTGWIQLAFSVTAAMMSSIAAQHCDFNCLSPRRPQTEELFNKLGHHERTSNLQEMMEKLKVF